MSTSKLPKAAVQIDLLPRQARYQALGSLRLRAFAGSLLVTVVALIGVRLLISATFIISGRGLSLHVEETESEIAELQRELEQRREALTALRDKRKAAHAINSQRHTISKMLAKFSSLTPDGVTIRSVELAQAEIQVSGVARDIETVREWMKEIVAACGGYSPTLQQLRVVQFGKVRAHEFIAHIVRPQALEHIDPCVAGEEDGEK
jgi:Tfp pilus assembly protein PilN